MKWGTHDQIISMVLRLQKSNCRFLDSRWSLGMTVPTTDLQCRPGQTRKHISGAVRSALRGGGKGLFFAVAGQGESYGDDPDEARESC